MISNLFYQHQASILGIPYFLFSNNQSNMNFFLIEDKYLKQISNTDLQRKYFCDAFEAFFAAFFYDKESLFPLYQFMANYTNCFLHNNEYINMLCSDNVTKQKEKVNIEKIFTPNFLSKEQDLISFQKIFFCKHNWSEMKLLDFNEQADLNELLFKSNWKTRIDLSNTKSNSLDSFQLLLDYKFNDI